LGWLLFSAPEYNVEELRRTILAITGVRVALRYRRIRDTLPKQVAGPPSTVKAIHIEVDTTTTQNQQESIGRVFSPKTKEFPVGIKMRLVAEIFSGTDSKACLKAKQ